MTEHFIRANAQGELRHYTAQLGKDEQGHWLPIQVTPQEADAFSGQQRQLTFKSLHVESDREGNVRITTEFFDDQFTPTGLHAPSFSRVISHQTKESEAQGFFDALRGMLERNILNALVAGGRQEGDGFLGHPHNRLFDAAGVRVPDTDATTTALPTFDYHTPVDDSL
jgi:hypothetical protein